MTSTEVTLNSGTGMDVEKTKVSEHLLVFNQGGEVATEPVHFEEDPDTSALFAEGKVSKPVPIIVEGKYIGSNFSGKAIEVSFDKTFLESLAANTKFDQPMNFDHWRGGPNRIGWVRASTGKAMFVDKLPDGRHALFAQIEVTPGVHGMIERGEYRRFSAEVNRAKKRLTGLALTNYPAIDGVHQFSDTDTDITPNDEGEQMSDTAQQNLEALQRELAEAKAALATKEAEANRAKRILDFSDKAQTVAKEKLVPALAPLVLELYLFAANHDADTIEVNFSLNGAEAKPETVKPVDLLNRLFEQLPKVELFTQTIAEGAEAMPKTGETEEDASFSSAVAARLKASLS